MAVQYWLADIPGTTISSSEGERIAVLGRDLSSTTTAAAVAALGDAVATTTVAATLGALGAITASAAEVSNKCDGSASYVVIPSGATYTVLTADSGKKLLLPGTTSSMTIALPAESTGLNYEFIYVGSAAEGQNIVIGSGSTSNGMTGGIVHLDLNSTAGLQDDIYCTGTTQTTLTLTTPAAGTDVNYLCSGTQWYVWGTVMSDSAPAFGTT